MALMSRAAIAAMNASLAAFTRSGYPQQGASPPKQLGSCLAPRTGSVTAGIAAPAPLGQKARMLVIDDLSVRVAGRLLIDAAAARTSVPAPRFTGACN